MFVYLDGRFVAGEDARVSVFDHGFLYGDGIYETMRAYGGRLFLLRQHLARLKRSAKTISLVLPLSMARIEKALNESLVINKLQDAYVRLHISRGPGAIGLDPALCAAPTMVITAKALNGHASDLYAQGVKTVVVKTLRNHPAALPPSVKSTNFLNNILAKIETVKARAYEGIMLNWKGYVAEGTVSNVFLVKKGVLYTPHVKTGILEGVTRDFVLRLARRNGIPFRETLIPLKSLLNADECFLTNTTMEVMPVSAVNGKRIGSGSPGPITGLLHESYRKEVQACLKTRAT